MRDLTLIRLMDDPRNIPYLDLILEIIWLDMHEIFAAGRLVANIQQIDLYKNRRKKTVVSTYVQLVCHLQFNIKCY